MSACKPEAEIERIWARKRWAADDEINHVVYKLYDLTGDEIAIVEEATQRASKMSDKVLRIYLDVCSLQRPFDDQRQARIRLEAEAIKLIIARVENGELEWLTSAVVDYEVAQNPDAERALKARLLAAYAGTRVVVDAKETARANELEQLGFTGFDALHLACAESGAADVFLTTDDKLLKRAARVATRLDVRVANPLQWAQEMIV